MISSKLNDGVVRLKFRELAARYSVRNILQNTGARKLFFQLTCFGCGFISSGGRIFGTYSPFGVSVVSAVPFKGMLSAVIGSTAGYIILGGRAGSFRYIAAMLAAAAIRWTLNDIKSISRHCVFAGAVSFVPTFATGLDALSVTGVSPQIIFRFFLEALIGGVAAYFFARAVVILHGTKSLGMLLTQEVSCLVLSGCIFILALSGITRICASSQPLTSTMAISSTPATMAAMWVALSGFSSAATTETSRITPQNIITAATSFLENWT